MMGKPDIGKLISSTDHKAKTQRTNKGTNIEQYKVNVYKHSNSQTNDHAQLTLILMIVHIRVDIFKPFLSII